MHAVCSQCALWGGGGEGAIHTAREIFSCMYNSRKLPAVQADHICNLLVHISADICVKEIAVWNRGSLCNEGGFVHSSCSIDISQIEDPAPPPPRTHVLLLSYHTLQLPPHYDWIISLWNVVAIWENNQIQNNCVSLKKMEEPYPPFTLLNPPYSWNHPVHLSVCHPVCVSSFVWIISPEPLNHF